jgi:hypothetical protein
VTRIYVLFSVVGWAWAVIVLAALLIKTSRDREGAKVAKQAAKENQE